MNISAIQVPSAMQPLGLRRPSYEASESQSNAAFAAFLSSAVSSPGLPARLEGNVASSKGSEESQTALNALDAAQEGPECSAGSTTADDERLQEVFQKFVGQTFFGLMLKEMRKSIHKTPYFHGGLAEEVFEQHLDMTLAEKLAESSGEQFAKPMYELFRLQSRR